GVGLAAPVETHEEGRRRVRDGTDGGCGCSCFAAGPGGGDDVDGSTEPAHGLAERGGLGRAHDLWANRREGAVHGIVRSLVAPAHYSLGRVPGARPTGKGNVIRSNPCGVAPAILVVIAQTLLRQRNHAVKRAGSARIP